VKPRIFTRRETALLEAIAARILPTTDTPGAVEAGAVNYIAEALAGPYRPLLSCYRRGLRQLDQYAQASRGQPFPELAESQQDALLAELESGTVTQVSDGTLFFELVRGHILEGVFGEPSYGGNRDLVGWRLVGFPGHQFGYPDPYINRAIDIPPIAVDGPPPEES
jgi:gluconate 2-dehydrogenase gamma chain